MAFPSFPPSKLARKSQPPAPMLGGSKTEIINGSYERDYPKPLSRGFFSYLSPAAGPDKNRTVNTRTERESPDPKPD